MKLLKVALSNDAPSVRDALWLKPVSGGFTLYALFNSKWNPLKMVDDNGTVQTGDDSVIDVENKADKVSSATNGNLASLDGNGNLKDSGAKASDFLTSHQDISGKANLSTIADAYSNSETYKVGDIRYHNGAFYECNTVIATAENWNAAHWNKTTVIAALKAYIDAGIASIDVT